MGVLVNSADLQAPALREGFYRELAARAARYRLQLVLVCVSNRKERGFPPDIRCCSLHGGAWSGMGDEDLRLDAVYDRFFARRRGEAAAAARFLRESERRWGCARLGGTLPDKWTVHLALRGDPHIRPLLPATAPFDAARLPDWLSRGGGRLLLKPSAGMQGRGVLALRRLAGGALEAAGRDGRNRCVRAVFGDAGACAEWLAGRTARPYLAQRLLDLRDGEGRPFDVRLLVQKDGGGRWRTTGSALRLGRTGGITSNLHGGGVAEEPLPFLTQLFGSERAGSLLGGIEAAGLRIVRRLECRFGRLAELGLDFGIDPAGRLWFLEANAKPGRSAFRRLGGPAARLSVERPLQYARYLLSRRGARVPRVPRSPGTVSVGTSKDHVQEVHV